MIEGGLSGAKELTEVFAKRGRKQELIAVGYSYEQAMEAEIEGQKVSWKEQRVVVRAEGFARQQATMLDNRIKRAKQKLLQLNQRKRGKKRLTKEEMKEAIDGILEKEAVAGLLRVEVLSESCEAVKGKRQKPSTRSKQEELRVTVEVEAGAVKHRQERVGWRVYATNQLEWSVEEVVKSYREQYLIERGFARLKGKSLGLQPHYIRSDQRVAGLLNLLVIGLRLLTLVEYTARCSLSLEENPEAKELKGIYRGQPQKSTPRPTSESLLKVFEGVSLVFQEMSGEIHSFITPLSELQKRILKLLNLSTYLYEGLASDCPQPDLFLSEI